MTISTILGAPHLRICLSSGMPLDDASVRLEPDGTFNEDCCRWCYTDGKYIYTDFGERMDFLPRHTASEHWPA